MKKLVLGLIATVMLSFGGNAQNLREKFLAGKTQTQIVSDFNKLSTSQKNDLWIEKMEQLLTQELPSEHIALIRGIKDLMIENKRSNIKEFVEPTLRLASITPEDDFVKMIESLYDYKYTGKFLGKDKTSDSILQDISKLGSQEPTDGDGEVNRPTCNCRYMCWLFGGGTSNCRETVDGCGPFGMSTCNGYV